MVLLGFYGCNGGFLFTNANQTHRFNVFDSALKPLENLGSLFTALRIDKRLRVEAVWKANQKTFSSALGQFGVELYPFHKR